MKTRFTVLIPLILAVLAGCKTKPAQVAHTPSTDKIVLASPDEQLYATVYLDQDGTPVYEKRLGVADSISKPVVVLGTVKAERNTLIMPGHSSIVFDLQ